MSDLPGHIQHMLDSFNQLPQEDRARLLAEQVAQYGLNYKPGERQAQVNDLVLHEAYMRLRDIIPGAYATPHAPVPAQIYETVEEAARRLVTERNQFWDEVVILRRQRMAPERERELLAANNRYLERARAAERAVASDPWIDRCAWIAQRCLDLIGPIKPVRDEQGLSLGHLAYLFTELAERRVGSGTKSCRWLGYAQGGLITKGLLSLEDAKEMNMASRDEALILAQPLTYQERVKQMIDHVAADDPTDLQERMFRFLEEALELVQSLGCGMWQARKLVDHVFSRAVGEPMQEMGGAMVTLFALAPHAGLDAAACGERELERCNTPEVIAKIREKRAGRPRDGWPLPSVNTSFEDAVIRAPKITIKE